MDKTGILTTLRNAASAAGFPLFGVVRAEASRDSEFASWLAAGCGEGMAYLMKNEHAFRHPESLLPGVRSVVMLGMPYEEVCKLGGNVQNALFQFAQFSENDEIPPGFGRVARYACPVVDYHDVIRKSLKTLGNTLCTYFPEAKIRGVVDTAPLHEREFARRAGLGVLGMNRMLIHARFGSDFFIAAMLTTAELPEFCMTENRTPKNAATFLDLVDEKCFACEKCIHRCPTNALSHGKFDASRCLNTLLIERRDFLPVQLWPAVGNRVFGCDVCQSACPTTASQPPLMLELAPLFSLTESEFRERFRHTPFFRTGRDALLRNAAIVLANEHTPAARATLTYGLQDASELVRETCRVALNNSRERK